MADDLGHHLMTMLEGMGPLTEAAIGFRATLVAAGYPDELAWQLTAELHRGLIAACFKERSDHG